jgi:chromosome segregation protein
VYLKSLELIGFKSFADKTVLSFEPGMTCIVGPNGCGKSNVSDAIRWVLGEQSAKALRGSRMEDCIFNGTDDRKPLGMAEVAISFADCEKALGTEYNEVTVTRRVFRDGEGEYFLNKTPCRLKDVQRLFMDTGIGTTSYSLMEQGRIDQILSSRPEDRRTIFEEASGITKFKSDKKEALRKLEQTEANLLRLADVIREVKRQIGSLQRQVGKARRYKEYTEELRRLDLYATRERLKLSDEEIHRVEAEVASLQETIAAAAREVAEIEEGSARLRRSVLQTEHEAGIAAEQAVQAQGRLDHTREMIGVNRQRIEEYRALSERESREIGQAQQQIREKEDQLADLGRQTEAAARDHAEAQQQLQAIAAECERGRAAVETRRERIRLLRDESVETESLLVRLQNQLVELETQERSASINRERLAAEKAKLAREAADYEERSLEMARSLDTLREESARREARVSALESDRAAKREAVAAREAELAEANSRLAAAEARIELLSHNQPTASALPAGTRLLLDEAGSLRIRRDAILGTLGSLIAADPPYGKAAEVALRSSLDAVLVLDSDSAADALRQVEAAAEGPVRLLALDRASPPSPPPPVGERLLDHIRCPDRVRPALEHLIGNVLVVESLDAVPFPPAPHLAYVTSAGSLVRGDGWMEFWMAGPGSPASVSWAGMIADEEGALTRAREQCAACRERIAAASGSLVGVEKEIEQARRVLEEARRALAQKEGESRVIGAEGADARQRLETVTWEISDLAEREGTGDAARENLVRQMAELRTQRESVTSRVHEDNEQLHREETEHSALHTRLTEQRILAASLAQKLENATAQQEAAQTRIRELAAAMEGRSQDVASHQSRIEDLQKAIGEAEGRLETLGLAVREHSARAEDLRRNRDQQGEELQNMEKLLSERRSALDALRSAKSGLDVQAAEARMRRQNLCDRVTSEYSVSLDQVQQEPEPPWPDGVRPSLDAVETMVAELRTKIEAMGLVNMMAIQECTELEERFTFLTAQETDLVTSKEQLKDMIRKINKTTSEMFRTTFDRVNENFLAMFRKLFNGGSAKLVLVNEEDVLECGIEIIAKPPGKRLQNVSLLSGGERTLTAVALLFSIYQIKPSPFCLLDELDAALDDTNIGRFVTVLQEFLAQSQFVVITHNRQTIGAGRTLYGVTMPEKGISKIVSMKFKDRRDTPWEPVETSK